MAKFPSVSSLIPADLRRFLDRVREAFEGSNPVVTRQDLVDSGSHTRTTSGGLTTAAAVSNCSTPPAPQSLTASGAMTSIILTWDGTDYGSSFCHSYTQIWRADSDNFTNATMIGVSNGKMFTDAVGSDATKYYWARFVNANNQIGPLNATAGTVGATAPDTAYLVSQLSGALAESELVTSLNTRIDLIDDPNTVPGSVNARVKAEQDARVAGDDSLATQISQLSVSNDAGFDYELIWYFDANVESFTGNGTPTAVSGYIRPANHATDPYIITPQLSIDSVSTPQVKTRIRKVGTPTWEGKLYYKRTTDSTWDEARMLQITPEPTFTDGVAAVTWDMSSTWDGTIEYVRLDAGSDADASNYYEFDWIAIGRSAPGASTAQITTLETTKIGYCDISGTPTDHVDRATCEAAGGTWNIGIPFATAVKQVSVNDGSGGVALEQRFVAQKATDDALEAQYTVKVDASGYVSGFGLASTVNDATPFSEFAIVADKFSIAPVATSHTADDGSPFFHLTAPTTINGVSIPAGTYMKAVHIHDASITNAKIGALAVDTANIANAAITELKVEDGAITNLKIGNVIQSNDSGVSWSINKAGGIDARSITIRDSSGNILMSSGGTLSTDIDNSAQQWDDILGAGKPDDNATATEITNMILNGRANRGSNLNWSTAEYRADEGVNGGPCFYKNAPSPTSCRSDELIPISETEYYLLTASARVSVSGMQVYLGVQCFDADGLAIDHWECWRDVNKNTTLYEAVTQGALTVKIVPTAEDWFAVTTPFSYLQWDIAADFSDLPQQTATKITNIDKTTAGSGYWTLTLDTPAPASYPLGTPVGNSRSGGSATYTLNSAAINTTDWVHFENTLTPCADKTRAPLPTEIRAGTRYVRFIWWPGYQVGGEAWLDSVAMVPVSSWEAQPWTSGTSLADAINNVHGISDGADVTDYAFLAADAQAKAEAAAEAARILAETNAAAYADGEITAAEAAAIAAAAADATAKADAAEAAAIAVAAADAQAKADAAAEAARVLAETNAAAYADGEITAAEAAAIAAAAADATSKANAAQAAAILAANATIENGVLTVKRPIGGTYSSNSAGLGAGRVDGAIVVRLPQSWTNHMMRMDIDVFTYSQDRSFTVQCGGYSYSASPQWLNEFARVLGSTLSDNRVRFSHDGTRCVIIIGNAQADGTASQWFYPKVAVRDFMAGFAAVTIDQWIDDWSISIVNPTNWTTAGYATPTGDFSNALLDARSVDGLGATEIENQLITINADGTLTNAGGGAVNALSLLNGPTEANATNGATIGTNLFGQMNAGNISTFIANAAIGDALIDNLSADKIDAGTLTARTVQTAASGQRMVLNASTNEAEFYDTAGVKQATIGLNPVGVDEAIIKIGSPTANYFGVYAQSDSLPAGYFESTGPAMQAESTSTVNWHAPLHLRHNAHSSGTGLPFLNVSLPAGVSSLPLGWTSSGTPTWDPPWTPSIPGTFVMDASFQRMLLGDGSQWHEFMIGDGGLQASTGYIRMSNGFQICWGSDSRSASVPFLLTYANSFTSILMVLGVTSDGSASHMATFATNTQVNMPVTGAGTWTSNYIAIGYSA